MSSKLSTTISPTPCCDGEFEFFVGLGVAVQDQPGRVDPRLQRGQDLAAAGDVDVQALLDHHSLNGGARERLRREGHIATRPPTAEGGQIVACPLTQRVLGDDDRRGTEPLGDLVEAATADHECAVVVGSGARRKEADQLLGRRLGVDRHRLSLPPVPRGCEPSATESAPKSRAGCTLVPVLLCL